MVHRNARLAPAVRLILVQRVLQGRPVAYIAKELGGLSPAGYDAIRAAAEIAA